MRGQHFGDFVLFVGVQMRIHIERGLDILMPKAFADGQRRHAQFDEHACVAMAQIVNTDALNARKLAVLTPSLVPSGNGYLLRLNITLSALLVIDYKRYIDKN